MTKDEATLRSWLKSAELDLIKWNRVYKRSWPNSLEKARAAARLKERNQFAWGILFIMAERGYLK